MLSDEYEFRFVKQDKLGLCVAFKHFRVKRVHDGGAVHSANKKLEDSKKLQVGHYITAVNAINSKR